MNINYELLQEIYGEDIKEAIDVNMDIIEKNCTTMKEYGFTDPENLFERNVDIFLFFPKQFKEKMDKLIEELGPNYVKKIEEDNSILERLFEIR